MEEGGAEKLLVDTINELLIKYQFEIHLITTLKGNNRLINEIAFDTNFHFQTVGGRSTLGVIKFIKNYIIKNNIGIVHAHLFYSQLISRLACPSYVKLICTYHNMDFKPSATYYSYWRTWIEKLTFKKKYYSIYVSKEVQLSVEKVRRSNPDNAYVIHNFSDSSISAGYEFKNEKQLKLITIANIKKVKNLGFAIKAMKEMNDLQISWDIYGDGDGLQAFKEEIKDTPCAVRFLGWHKISMDLLAPYDLFVMTSYDEGMPISLLEALNFGMPSILPNHINVMKEVAGDSARYFSIYDIKEFRTILIDILTNKKQLAQMNDVAIRRAQLFSKEQHIENLMNIYKL